MEWTIPGTVLTGRREEADSLCQQFSALFLGGGIVLSQVCAITGLEAYTVQNWVKRGFLPPPQNKRYNLNQLCRILTIHMLKDVLPMEDICALLGYVNGELDDESDDVIDDAALYFIFARLAARAKQLDDPAALEQAMAEALADYREPEPGARKHVEQVLQIMLLAWIAAQMSQRARASMENLLKNKERNS